MSKTTNDLISMLASTDEQLFDRYINFRLSRADSPTALIDDLVFRTPDYGMKPDITLSGTLNAQRTVNGITLTIKNISENIDCNQYGFIEIEAGYKKSGDCIKFRGTITNCYMAKPNPNGELVIGCVNASATDLFAQDVFTVKFDVAQVTVEGLVNKCVSTINATTGSKITVDYTQVPTSWRTVIFNVNNGTYQFRSALECITWMNSMFMSHAYTSTYSRKISTASAVGVASKQITPLVVRFDSTDLNKLVLCGLYTNNSLPVVKALSHIGSAYITGNSAATITAPFVPGIEPGEFIYVDAKYFKTRLNLQSSESFQKEMKKLGSIWEVISVQFTFSTYTTNSMTLQLANCNNSIAVTD